MRSSNAIGVGIAGLGFGEIVHIPAIKGNPNFDLIRLWHPRKERLEEAYQRNNIKTEENWFSLLENKEINALIIATPPKPRFKLALEALNAGKHLLLEKPAALNSKEIKELQKLSISKNLTVAVNYEYRAVPLFMEAQEIIKRGDIGTPWLIRLDWLMSSRANENREWNWYSQKEEGGGVLGALGTHAFDILQWLCGPIISVNSLLSTSIKERPKKASKEKLKVTSEDIALGQFEIKEKYSEKIIPAQVSLSSVSREGRGFLLEIYGSKGTLVLSSANQKDYVHGFGLWFALQGEKLKQINPSEEFIFSKTWTDGRIAPVSRIQNWWGESIINNRPIIPGLSEALSSQKVCDAMKTSNENGQKTYLD